MEKKGWKDVTVALEDGMVSWPGDRPVIISKTATYENDKVNVTAINISAHTSTHVDAPLHFIKDGKDVTELLFEKLIGTARVIQIDDTKCISQNSLKNIYIEKGDSVLFKTRHSEESWSLLPFQMDYVYLTKEAALFLIEKEIACVGIDYLSIAEFSNGEEVHRLLLEKEIVIIEGIDLSNIKPGNYDMICLPLKIKGADGAPARVLLREKQ